MRKSSRIQRQSSVTASNGLVAHPDSQQWHSQVAARAYELYEARGCQDGHDVEDWLTAERDLSQPSR